MLGRLFFVLVGLALMATGVMIWRPELLHQTMHLGLGMFEPHRPIFAGVTGELGFAIVIASLLRPRRRAKPAAPAGPEGGSRHDDDEASHTLVEWSAEPAPASEPSPAASAHFVLATAAEVEHASASEATAAPDRRGQRQSIALAVAAADRLKAGGHLFDAIDGYEDALADACEAHASSAPDSAAAQDLSAVLERLAGAQEEAGRLDEAIGLHEQGLGLRRALAAAAPDDPAAQRSLSHGLGLLAEARESRGHRSRARDLYAECISVLEPLAASFEEDRPGLAAAHARLEEMMAPQPW